MLECIIGIRFNDCVMIASDMNHFQSIINQSGADNKMHHLSPFLTMAVTGEPGDTIQFSEYISKNIALYKMRNGYDLPPTAAAHFTRNILATHLRSREPYNVNLLMGGYDKEEKTSHLFYIDYLAAQMPVDFYAFGYGGMFTLSVLQKEYRADMSREDGYKLLEKCVGEVKRRFIANLPKFRVTCMSGDGMEEMETIVAVGEPA